MPEEVEEVETVTCEWCITESQPENVLLVDGSAVCQGCFEGEGGTCNICLLSMHEDNAYWTQDDGPYCETCFELYFTMCNGCGEYVHTDDAQPRGIHSYCFTCRDARRFSERGTGSIMPYNYSPDLVFHGNPIPGEPYLGFELEIENYRDRHANIKVADEMVKDLGSDLVFCKEDGSLSNGFEIASHPFTWQWWVKHRNVFDPIFERLPKYGFRSHRTSTCGMHVHVSRSAFGKSHLYKILKLVYDYQPFTEGIAQRQDSQYSSYAVQGRARGTPRSLLQKAMIREYDPQKYVAVNTGSSANTVEYRMFRGTLRKERFHKNMEFTYATFRYAREMGTKDINPETFAEFVSNKHKTYANLHAFMQERSL